MKWLGLLLLLTGCAKPLPPVTPATAADVLNVVRNSGAKVVVVNLWASWCGPCREEMPDLVRLQRDYAGRGLRVVFVSWDDSAEEAAKFLAKEGITVPSFIKSTNQTTQAFLTAFAPKLPEGVPQTLIYDGTSQLHTNWASDASYKEFAAAVEAVLAGK